MNVKNILMTMVLTVIMTTTASAAKEKLGYVDLSRLFDEYYKTQDFDKTLEAKHKGFEEQRNAMIEKIRESQGKLGLLEEAKKTEMEQEIEKMKADLLEFDRLQKADLTKERNEKIREILLEIENKVSEYAEKEGYAMILNDRVLVFGDQTIDLTKIILDMLNAKK
ncbi:MAG: OmpH family outer membrane protein [Candidatus Omnitrophica bacterium]|nr:OmpH family outer membrane protein [Candidatus Omnitrophota bacterium]